MAGESSQVKVKSVNKTQLWMPAMGFLLAFTLGLVAYIVSPGLILALRDALPQLRRAPLTDETMQLLFAVIIFFVMLSFTALLVAITAKRRPLNVTLETMDKERKETISRKKSEKRRQRRINQITRDELRKGGK